MTMRLLLWADAAGLYRYSICRRCTENWAEEKTTTQNWNHTLVFYVYFFTQHTGGESPFPRQSIWLVLADKRGDKITVSFMSATCTWYIFFIIIIYEKKKKDLCSYCVPHLASAMLHFIFVSCSSQHAIICVFCQSSACKTRHETSRAHGVTQHSLGFHTKQMWKNV